MKKATSTDSLFHWPIRQGTRSLERGGEWGSVGWGGEGSERKREGKVGKGGGSKKKKGERIRQTDIEIETDRQTETDRLTEKMP